MGSLDRASLAAVVGVEGVAEHFEGFAELGLVQHIGHAHFVVTHAGGGVEAGGGGHEDGLAFIAEVAQAPFAEAVGIIYRQAYHGVERSHGNRGIAAGNLVDAVDQEFAALHIFIVCFKHVFLAAVDRGFGHELSEQWGAEACLAELHHILLQLLVLCDEGADADAAFVVSF